MSINQSSPLPDMGRRIYDRVMLATERVLNKKLFHIINGERRGCNFYDEREKVYAKKEAELIKLDTDEIKLLDSERYKAQTVYRLAEDISRANYTLVTKSFFAERFADIFAVCADVMIRCGVDNKKVCPYKYENGTVGKGAKNAEKYFEVYNHNVIVEMLEPVISDYINKLPVFSCKNADSVKFWFDRKFAVLEEKNEVCMDRYKFTLDLPKNTIDLPKRA